MHDFEFPEVPILGINTGHLGFFPDFSPSDIDHFIESYLVGDYIVQEIPVLQSTVCTVCKKEPSPPIEIISSVSG